MARSSFIYSQISNCVKLLTSLLLKSSHFLNVIIRNKCYRLFFKFCSIGNTFPKVYFTHSKKKNCSLIILCPQQSKTIFNYSYSFSVLIILRCHFYTVNIISVCFFFHLTLCPQYFLTMIHT